VLALAAFHRCGLTDAHTGLATRLNIAVLAPSTSHEISVGKVRAWLDSNGRSPTQQALKVRFAGSAGKRLMTGAGALIAGGMGNGTATLPLLSENAVYLRITGRRRHRVESGRSAAFVRSARVLQ
jgi:hypothetical protein